MYIKKFPQKMIDDFIAGTKIEGYDFSELEDDETFMREVLITSKNYKMYRLCSDRLKQDPEFVIFAVEVFIDNETFASLILSTYFEKNNDYIKSDEMKIMLASLYEQYKFDYLSEYKKEVWEIYEYEKLRVDELLSRNTNPKWQAELGIGFRLVMEHFQDSVLVPFFIAENFVIDLFEKSNAEKEMHHRFKTVDELNNYGINNYIISFVAEHDHYLSSFLEQNLDAMLHANNLVKTYISRWDVYDIFAVSEILNGVSDYVLEAGLDEGIKNKFIVYIVNKYDLNNTFLKSEEYAKILQSFYSWNSNVDYKAMEFIPSEMVMLNDIKNIFNHYVDIKEEQKERFIPFNGINR